MLTAQQLRELVHYDPETGVFTWRPRRVTVRQHRVWNSRYAGKTTGNKHYLWGYLEISIFGRHYQAHRLAWLYVTGNWPECEIDHQNGVPDDNRFCNLREATRAQNAWNRRGSGKLKGASRRKQTGRWQAAIKKDGRTHHLGLFDTEEAAHTAYVHAAQSLFGEFARPA